MTENNEKILKRAEIEDNETEKVAGGIGAQEQETLKDTDGITILKTATGGAFVVECKRGDSNV